MAPPLPNSAHGDPLISAKPRGTARFLSDLHMCDALETDWLAEHVRLELRNVDAMYPFITSHRFLGIQPNSGHRDYSRLSCDIAKTQLRPNASLRKGYLRRPPLWPPLIGVVDRPPACCKSHRPVPWLAQAFQLFYMLCDYGLRHLEPA
jgi:hypothetical protein